jgi:hypothetical protein
LFLPENACKSVRRTKQKTKEKIKISKELFLLSHPRHNLEHASILFSKEVPHQRTRDECPSSSSSSFSSSCSGGDVEERVMLGGRVGEGAKRETKRRGGICDDERVHQCFDTWGWFPLICADDNNNNNK